MRMSQPTSLQGEMIWNTKHGEHQNKLHWPATNTMQAQRMHLVAPYGMSNMHTAKGHQGKVYDGNMLARMLNIVANKPTVYTDVRQRTSVTSTHASVTSYLLPPGWSLDAVKWHGTQMVAAVSHLYTSLDNMIVPMMPSLKPDFVWIFADDLYIVHKGLLPSIEVPIH